MGKVDFEVDTGFPRQRTFEDWLLEWTIPLLWLMVALVIVAVFVWL